MKGTGSVDYTFNDLEIKQLILLLRKHEAVLDKNLDVFRGFLEDYIYCLMTIEEAETFFHET